MDTKTLLRFWNKVDKTDSCWNWIAGKDREGYGEFAFTKYRKGHTRAHQASWVIHHGDIPNGMSVCHTCDNPACVRPDHLYLGTMKDNMRDREERGRGNHRFLYGKDHPQHGTNSKFHKLTENDVLLIRKLKLSGNFTLREIAERFGVSHGVINNICQGRKWAWLK